MKQIMPRKNKEKIIDLIKENKIIGISVDTCIFHKMGYKFDSPFLQALQQFSSVSIPVIFSEIVINEIISHTNDNTKNGLDNLQKT
ncbi:PIN domain-containing protein [Commensalibacter nepenthis]|uniref:Isochorismatase-like domain-containing protein n=1 Tax=Commensalibacter nepenthis TaxID=3043872 RepID=A0ABT6Q515_9PROT|nr:hypothetical protein [Commensalibacter sp. TBRC 10068]MDI2111988.1 hypothetical protein [Commensalibacter sp. TBRC 10068]